MGSPQAPLATRQFDLERYPSQLCIETQELLNGHSLWVLKKVARCSVKGRTGPSQYFPCKMVKARWLIALYVFPMNGWGWRKTCHTVSVNKTHLAISHSVTGSSRCITQYQLQHLQIQGQPPKPPAQSLWSFCTLFLCIDLQFKFKPDVMTHSCSPSTWEAEAGGLWIPCQPVLHREILPQSNKETK